MLTGTKYLDYKILNDLNDKDLINYCSVNSQAKKICNDQDFWYNRIITKFPYLPLNIIDKYVNIYEGIWSEYYIDIRRALTNPNLYLTGGANNGRFDWVIIALNNGADIHHMNDEALTRAVDRGDFEMVKYLVDHGADIHVRDDQSLMVASENGYLDIVKYLIKNGVDVRTQNDIAVQYAYRAWQEEEDQKYIDVINYLVSLGSDDPR